MQRILFIYGPLNSGGAEKVLLDFLTNLDRKKYDIHLCLMIAGGNLRDEIPKDIKAFSLWKTYNYYFKFALRFSTLFGNDFLFKRILHQKIKNEYDVIISFLEGMPLKLHSLLDYSAKNITWVHADLGKYNYTKKLFYQKNEKSAYEKMDTVVCVSKEAEKSFLNKFLDFKKEIITIHNPVDIEKIQFLSESFEVPQPKYFSVILVSRLTVEKRIDRLLKVAERCKTEELKIEFQIIGNGESSDELKKISKNLELNEIIKFIGYQSNPYPFIKSADILISVSDSEGFGLVLCEAMALGVSVISTKTAGAIEILDNNQFGLLCEHDENSIFDALKQMYEDENLRKGYIEKGRERVKDFKLKKAIEKFDKLLLN